MCVCVCVRVCVCGCVCVCVCVCVCEKRVTMKEGGEGCEVYGLPRVHAASVRRIHRMKIG